MQHGKVLPGELNALAGAPTLAHVPQQGQLLVGGASAPNLGTFFRQDSHASDLEPLVARRILQATMPCQRRQDAGSLGQNGPAKVMANSSVDDVHDVYVQEVHMHPGDCDKAVLMLSVLQEFLVALAARSLKQTFSTGYLLRRPAGQAARARSSQGASWGPRYGDHAPMGGSCRCS